VAAVCSSEMRQAVAQQAGGAAAGRQCVCSAGQCVWCVGVAGAVRRQCGSVCRGGQAGVWQVVGVLCPGVCVRGAVCVWVQQVPPHCSKVVGGQRVGKVCGVGCGGGGGGSGGGNALWVVVVCVGGGV